MLQSEHNLLQPGTIVRIGPCLRGEELYGADDPEEYRKWCGKEATVKKIDEPEPWMVYIEEDDSVCFFMEEIECIVNDVEIAESSESISVLLGGAI